ncbi:bacteriohemerythrin [Sulfuricurvum sp.]|uniref:bacteriohemerythrin n=1 Tax=Sulfuricurvum sp. TaxID=2025608 RepID=UPI003BB5B220
MFNIDIFPWNEHFATGLSTIDDQHRKLVKILNDLATNVAFNADSEALNAIFDELTDYTLYHFQTEEVIWHQYLPYDPLDSEHQNVHQQFVTVAMKFKEEQKNKPLIELAKEALEYLARWLASHILETDRHMAYIVFALREGLSIDEAKIRANEQMSGSTRMLIDIILSIYRTLTSNTLELVHEMKEHEKLLSDQKMIETKLNDQAKYQQLLLELANSFVNLPLDEIDSAIESAIEKMAIFVKADRAYIFDYDVDAQTTSNTYEWCKEGISPEIDHLQDLPLDTIPGWFVTHSQGKSIIIDNVSLLEEGSVKSILMSQNIQNLITLPLINQNICVGFVGFDSVKKQHHFSDLEITLLDLFSNLLSNVHDRRLSETRLKYERGFLKTLINTIPDLIWLKTPDGLYLNCNPRFEALFGAKESEIVGKTDYDFVSKELADFFRHHDRNVMETNSTNVNEEEVTFSDGHIEFLETTKTPMKDESGNLLGVLSVGRNITERKLAEKLLQEQKEEFETIFNISRDGIAVLDLESNFLDFNEAYLEMTGYTRGELLTKSCIGLSAPEDHDRAINALMTVMKKGFLTNFEKTCIVKNGKHVVINMAIALMPDRQKLLISTKDITEAKAQEQKLQYIAHYDALTGLPNRILLSDRLQQAMMQASRNRTMIAVVYLDLDGFKAINDLYGHEVGDILLSTLASRMKQTLRNGDTIARLGGDEFVAIFPDLKEHEECVSMLIRLLSVTSHTVMIDGVSMNVSASLGVSFFEEGNDIDPDQLLRQADQAMYQAKLSGKNRYHIFDTVQDRTIRTHHESLEAIELALTNNQFQLYYQPKVNMKTGEVIGAEALIRWNHPEKGILAPRAFLPMIEDHILSVDVGYWVIEEAMRQLTVFKRAGLQLSISVNVDALQLQQEDFVSHLKTLMEHYPEIREGDLEFEILETSALEDIDGISKIMHECGKIGIHFSLDDFGTGYSSLTYLKRLPAKILKIDQSFVKGMLGDPDDLAILDGVVGLSVAFRRHLIAEGVESREHGEMLLNLGCMNAQGYAIARPMLPENFMEWIKQWKPDETWTNAIRISRDDIPLLFAEVEHKAWVEKIIQFMHNERLDLPSLDYEECHFGQWLKTDGEKRYREIPLYSEMEQAHKQVHHLVNRMIKQKESLSTELTQALIDSLLQDSDTLISLLKQLSIQRQTLS